MASPTGCDCVVCSELSHFHSVTGVDDVSDLTKMAAALSPEVQAILLAQNKVRNGNATTDDEEIVKQAAARCTAAELFKEVLSVKVH